MARKGKEVIRSGLVLLGGDSEENGDNTGGHLHWGVNGKSHRLGIPAQESDTGKISTLVDWRAGVTKDG